MNKNIDRIFFNTKYSFWWRGAERLGLHTEERVCSIQYVYQHTLSSDFDFIYRIFLGFFLYVKEADG